MQGWRINAYAVRGRSNATTVVFGGFHGDEPKSVEMACAVLVLLGSEPDFRRLGRWIVVPLVNPDGFSIRKRRNANGVDINRNFPTSNWKLGKKRSRMFGGNSPASEPETRAVVRLIERFRPKRIITIHSISGGRQCNNYDGPGRRLAKMMNRFNGYPVTASIGYETPGSFGTWAGIELGIITLTLELPSTHSIRQCLRDNLPGFEALTRTVRLVRPVHAVQSVAPSVGERIEHRCQFSPTAPR